MQVIQVFNQLITSCFRGDKAEETKPTKCMRLTEIFKDAKALDVFVTG